MPTPTPTYIDRRAVADEILSEIIRDLHTIDQSWTAVDVDVRNEYISKWRYRILGGET